MGGIEVPGIPWGVIIGGLLLTLFLISIPFVGLIGAVGFTVFIGFIAFWCWITVESGVGYALDAKSLAQGKMERDDRIVWRNLYKICEKYHQGKTARQIAIQDYNHDISIASIKRGIKKEQIQGIVEIQTPPKK